VRCARYRRDLRFRLDRRFYFIRIARWPMPQASACSIILLGLPPHRFRTLWRRKLDSGAARRDPIEKKASPKYVIYIPSSTAITRSSPRNALIYKPSLASWCACLGHAFKN
jgi:hypothetical protein